VEAFLRALATHLPENVVTNEQLEAENPDWDMARIASKAGIEARHIVGKSETAGDLAYAAGCKLLIGCGIDPKSIDYLVYCTQSPDYVLPATSCVLQARLGLPTTSGAVDINHGCSGYVYGLQLARALVLSGSARNVLFLTAETYSRYIHPRDWSVRVLFGDAASASLISADGPGARIGGASLGTDGRGAANLSVGMNGRPTVIAGQSAGDAHEDADDFRLPTNLYMNGPQLVSFALREVPELVRQTLAKNDLTANCVKWYVFHQANAFMNGQLGAKLGIDPKQMPSHLKLVGNTVSNTIPLTLMHSLDQFSAGDYVMLVGFGVGYSWGACVLCWDKIQTA
jgi:3-oxoacyl-[acyl-carrier-protein] synthase-3